MVGAQAHGAGKDTCGRYLSCVLRARLCGACQAFLWNARDTRGSLFRCRRCREYCERMQQVWCLARCPCPQPPTCTALWNFSRFCPQRLAGWLCGDPPLPPPSPAAFRRHGCPLVLGLHAHSSLPGFLATAAAGDFLGRGGGGQFPGRGWLVVWWRCLFVCGGPGLL